MNFINYPNTLGSRATLNAAQEVFVSRAIERGKAYIRRAIAEGRIPPTAASLLAVRDHVTIGEITAVLGEVEEISALFPKSDAGGVEAFTVAVKRVMDALDDWLPNFDERNADLITRLVDDALNSACRSVQSQLDIRSGDTAAAFFVDRVQRTVEEILRRYVVCELRALDPHPAHARQPTGSLG
jgi:hypothetical protein